MEYDVVIQFGPRTALAVPPAERTIGQIEVPETLGEAGALLALLAVANVLHNEEDVIRQHVTEHL